MRNLKSCTLTAAAAVALLSGPAWAAPITVNPYATELGYGSPTVPNYQLESTTVLSDTAITGGLGTGYEKVYTGSNASGTGPFSAEMDFNITSLTGIAGSLGLGSTWQLFAIATVTGTGTWSSTAENGKTPGFVVAPGATVAVQVYGVKGTGDSFKDPTINTTGSPPAAPSVTPLTAGTSIAHDPLTAGSSTDPDHYNLSTSNLSHVGTHACWDGTNIGGTSNCILLADGTSSTISMMIGGQLTGNSSTFPDTEEFSLSTTLSPETYAAGATGFWDADTNISLIINSGGGTTEDWVAVNDNTCTSTPVVCQFETNNAGVAVNWDVTSGTGPINGSQPVPEPSTLMLLGSALAGFGWLSRRQQSRF